MSATEPRRSAPARPARAMQPEPPPDSIQTPRGWETARLAAKFVALAYFVGWVLLFLTLRFSSVGAHGNEMNLDRAVFLSTSAATLTGFQQSVGVRELAASGSSGPFALLLMTLAATVASLLIGGLAAVRILRLPYSTSQVASAAFTSVLLSSVAGAAALAGTGRSVFEAVFQAVCAFGNSGLSLGPAQGTTFASTFLVLLPLVILGGLGLPVLMEASDRLFGGARLSRHSALVLRLAGIAYLVGLVALVLAQVPAAEGGGWPAWRNTLASCSVAAIDTRSAGIPFQSPAAFTAAGQWILMALMVVGAAPAGTAGGLKTTTLWQTARGVGDLLRGRTPHRATGIAAVWIAAYAAVLFLGMLLLVSSEPQIPTDRLLFVAVSAISNVGLSHDPIAITGPGLYVLSALMLFGRVAPWLVLWWMAKTTVDAEVVVG